MDVKLMMIYLVVLPLQYYYVDLDHLLGLSVHISMLGVDAGVGGSGHAPFSKKMYLV